MTTCVRHPSSFRDPAGFVFLERGVVYRQVNEWFAPHYDHLMKSGLYAQLVEAGMLLPHDEVSLRLPGGPRAHAVLRPQHVPFVSYPYEWCFGQLKAASLLTLAIQKSAVSRGMVLRDASAYNVQFVAGRPILIDTLSLGLLANGQPWMAYRQFCQHFLAPLALMAFVDPSLGQLLRVHIDGIPLALAARMLPRSTLLRPGLLTHIHLHARAASRSSSVSSSRLQSSRAQRMTPAAMSGLIESLESTVRRMRWAPDRTQWADYYRQTNYSPAAHQAKQEIVAEFVRAASAISPLEVVWDVGANTGLYTTIAARSGASVLSFDSDYAAVERHYRECVRQGQTRVLPLVQDITNPTPSNGWRHNERQSLERRGPADLALALAVVHHLALTHNIPLSGIAEFFHSTCRHLIIEFVPEDDSQVVEMLALRDNVFTEYHQAAFEEAFRALFTIHERRQIPDSRRVLYRMERQ